MDTWLRFLRLSVGRKVWDAIVKDVPAEASEVAKFEEMDCKAK